MKNESPLFLKASTQKNKMDGCHHLISGCVAHPLGSVGACFQMTSSATQATAQLVTLGSGDHACHIICSPHLIRSSDEMTTLVMCLPQLINTGMI